MRLHTRTLLHTRTNFRTELPTLRIDKRLLLHPYVSISVQAYHILNTLKISWMCIIILASAVQLRDTIIKNEIQPPCYWASLFVSKSYQLRFFWRSSHEKTDSREFTLSLFLIHTHTVLSIEFVPVCDNRAGC